MKQVAMHLGTRYVNITTSQRCALELSVSDFNHSSPHIAGVPGAATREIWGPGDIEGHMGTDGRYYVLDFARTFPPEHPGPARNSCKGSVFFRLLRPEFVKTYKERLSPDALVGWGRADPRQPDYNQQILHATLFLREVLVPTLATELNAEVEIQHLDARVGFLKGIGHRLHSYGVNLRYLGLVRSHSTSPFLQQCLLGEMVRFSAENHDINHSSYLASGGSSVQI